MVSSTANATMQPVDESNSDVDRCHYVAGAWPDETPGSSCASLREPSSRSRNASRAPRFFLPILVSSPNKSSSLPLRNPREASGSSHRKNTDSNAISDLSPPPSPPASPGTAQSIQDVRDLRELVNNLQSSIFGSAPVNDRAEQARGRSNNVLQALTGSGIAAPTGYGNQLERPGYGSHVAEYSYLQRRDRANLKQREEQRLHDALVESNFAIEISTSPTSSERLLEDGRHASPIEQPRAQPQSTGFRHASPTRALETRIYTEHPSEQHHRSGRERGTAADTRNTVFCARGTVGVQTAPSQGVDAGVQTETERDRRTRYQVAGRRHVQFPEEDRRRPRNIMTSSEEGDNEEEDWEYPRCGVNWSNRANDPRRRPPQHRQPSTDSDWHESGAGRPPRVRLSPSLFRPSVSPVRIPPASWTTMQDPMRGGRRGDRFEHHEEEPERATRAPPPCRPDVSREAREIVRRTSENIREELAPAPRIRRIYPAPRPASASGAAATVRDRPPVTIAAETAARAEQRQRRTESSVPPRSSSAQARAAPPSRAATRPTRDASRSPSIPSIPVRRQPAAQERRARPPSKSRFDKPITNVEDIKHKRPLPGSHSRAFSGAAVKDAMSTCAPVTGAATRDMTATRPGGTRRRSASAGANARRKPVLPSFVSTTAPHGVSHSLGANQQQLLSYLKSSLSGCHEPVASFLAREASARARTDMPLLVRLMSYLNRKREELADRQASLIMDGRQAEDDVEEKCAVQAHLNDMDHLIAQLTSLCTSRQLLRSHVLTQLRTLHRELQTAPPAPGRAPLEDGEGEEREESL